MVQKTEIVTTAHLYCVDFVRRTDSRRGIPVYTEACN